MSSSAKRRKRQRQSDQPGFTPDIQPVTGRREVDKALAQLIDDLRQSKAELEAQNLVLRYSQAAAEGASERFETLFASVPLALMVVDEYDMVVQANPTAHRLFQPTERDRPLTSLMPFVSAANLGRVGLAFGEARDQGRSEVTEVVFSITHDHTITGDMHIACIETPPQEADEGPLVQFLCAVIDQGPLLAERRALQQSAMAVQQRNEQLHASERRLEGIINSSLDAIICVDMHQRITVFNPTAAALFQCTAYEALGSRLDRFFPGAADMLAFSQVSTHAQLGELTAVAAGGRELPVDVSVTFERHSEGETTTVFARDLTSRKKAEENRATLELQLRESQKMQAIGTMAGGIAHDFNNILGAILGNVDLARGDTEPGSVTMVSLNEIDKAGRRARDLVRQILTFSRNDTPKLSPISVADVVHETEQLLRVTLPPDVVLQLRIDPKLPAVMADPTQLEQALLNLCTNALHAIGNARGTVTIRASAAHPDLLLRERIGLSAPHYVALTVTDTGQGMDAATLERIFEPFFTTKPVGQGTGLGLAVVHGVMRTHHGATDVQSTPGEGSTFTLYFPATSGPAEAIEPAAVPAPHAVDGGGHHVMYVDDDEALVFLVERLLRRRGFRVSAFTDPRVAAQALRDDPTAYDLLVTDYNMPGYCGVDLVREALSIRADLPVALASGYVTPEIERRALAEGARALIHKPNDVSELVATVQRLVAGDDAAAG